jgi:hypothetical protein
MSEDPRCCGTGTCIINADDMCWCGQRWDGEKMCFPMLDAVTAVNTTAPQDQPAQQAISASDIHKT